MRLQQMLSNGTSWVDVSEQEKHFYLDFALAKMNEIAAYKNEAPVAMDKVFAELAAGKIVQTGNDWYDRIRDAEVFERLDAEREARRNQVEKITCTCGHTVAKSLVMSTSNGTSCPDCYDRMSD